MQSKPMQSKAIQSKPVGSGQVGSGKITAISIIVIIGLSILGVITALSGGSITKPHTEQSPVTDTVDTETEQALAQ